MQNLLAVGIRDNIILRLRDRVTVVDRCAWGWRCVMCDDIPGIVTDAELVMARRDFDIFDTPNVCRCCICNAVMLIRLDKFGVLHLLPWVLRQDIAHDDDMLKMLLLCWENVAYMDFNMTERWFDKSKAERTSFIHHAYLTDTYDLLESLGY